MENSNYCFGENRVYSTPSIHHPRINFWLPKAAGEVTRRAEFSNFLFRIYLRPDTLISVYVVRTYIEPAWNGSGLLSFAFEEAFEEALGAFELRTAQHIIAYTCIVARRV